MALMATAMRGQTEVMDFLLKHRADIEIKDTAYVSVGS